MTSEERIRKQKELIEAIGRSYEKQGFQPITGRLLGLFIVMDKELYTFDEIVAELNISKSSASNALKMLEFTNTIEYITLPGDRKRYFKLKTQDKFTIINSHIENLEQTLGFLKKVLKLKANQGTSNYSYVSNIINIIEFYLDKITILKSEFIQQNKNLNV